ncbi:rubrerythrin [Acidobacteria bacterium ACD]|nr:MAG: rubrerythrin [Acidobacteriota bacterium]MCE7958119.1 rubrerythrin [Acidobacteria bacterium ACB2]MDL1949307.1 rubrerythrin [Acidobacteria bacterium ACD]
MTKTVDFASLTLVDALDLAVLIEDEARERYEEFGDQMETHHTAEAARFFRFMAVNETKHGQELAERRKELFGDAPTRMSRSMLWEVEAPEYDKVRAFMTPRQSLEVALESELKAKAFFEGAIPHVSDPSVKALFAELEREEEEHIALVKGEMEKLPPPESMDAEDFVDEPVAQ